MAYKKNNKYIYIRDRKTHYAVVLQYIDSTGKKKQKTMYKTDNKKEAERKRIELLNEVNKDRLNISEKTFVEAFKEYYNDPVLNLANNTKSVYYYTLKRYVEPFFGDTELSDVNVSLVNKFIAYVYSFDIKVSTRKTFLQKVMAVLTNCYKKQEINKDIARLVNINKREKKIKEDSLEDKNIYTLEEVQYILNNLDYNVPFSLALTTLLLTGCRFSEMAGLCWSDVDFEKKEITIQHNLVYVSGYKFEMRPPKTYRKRRFSVPDNLLKLYKDELIRQKKLKLMGEFKGKEFTDLVHINLRCTPWQNSVFSRDYKVFCKKHNIKKIRIHDLRHTHASILLSQGVDLKTVSERLGHTTLNMTFEVYAHSLKEADKKARNVFESIAEK